MISLHDKINQSINKNANLLTTHFSWCFRHFLWCLKRNSQYNCYFDAKLCKQESGPACWSSVTRFQMWRPRFLENHFDLFKTEWKCIIVTYSLLTFHQSVYIVYVDVFFYIASLLGRKITAEKVKLTTIGFLLFVKYELNHVSIIMSSETKKNYSRIGDSTYFLATIKNLNLKFRNLSAIFQYGVQLYNPYRTPYILWCFWILDKILSVFSWYNYRKSKHLERMFCLCLSSIL